jgi:membrane fusion protein, heavy metal efflux system
MSLRTNPATILVVDDDEMLRQVLSRVLTRGGHVVLPATDASQALQLASEHSLQLAIVDLCLPDRDGVELANALRERGASMPLILMTAYPLRLREHPDLTKQFNKVLTKPINLEELRQAIDDALAQEPASASVPFTKTASYARPNVLAASTKQRPEPVIATPEVPREVAPSRVKKMAAAVTYALVFLSLAVGFLMFVGILPVPWKHSAATAGPPPERPNASTLPGVELVPDQPHTLVIPDDVRKSLGLQKGNTTLIAEAKKPTKTQALVMPGSTALDPTRLYRIRARFAPSPSSAEVVEIAKVREEPSQSGTLESAFREIRTGDRVKKGDLLAVFYSVDVGNKKNDLIDAIYQLELDDEILKMAEANLAAVPPALLLSYRRAVQGDRNNIKRAVSTLETWGISKEDVQAVLDEAEKVKKREGKHDTEKDALWARVEMRAPDDGVIIERNLALHEIVVDNTTNLFQIAKVDRLAIFANVPEDDLPTLQALPTAQRRWTVETVGSVPIPGFVSDVGYLIDPNQHTAIVKGYIDNPKETLRAGQFIKATVELPPPEGVVEVPIDAVSEDGQAAVVFVQTDPAKHHYAMRRVQVTHRFDKTAFVRSTPIPKEEQRTKEEEELGVQPKEPLRPGERVLTSGVGELKAALLDKESERIKERKEGKDK